MFHPACHTYFFRKLDGCLLQEMETLLSGLRERLGRQDMRFYRQVEIDMDNDLRKRIKDMEECVGYGRFSGNRVLISSPMP